MKNKLTEIILMIVAIVLALTPFHIAPVCPLPDEGKPMKCHWTGRAVIGVAICLVVLAVILFILKDQRIKLGIYISVIIFGLLTLALSTVLIGVCKSPEMPCVQLTGPLLQLESILIAVLGAVGIYSNRKYNYHEN